MKKILFTLLLIYSSILFSQKQKSSKMGQTTLDELMMTVYEKDATAGAVVLYEHANRYPDKSNDEIPRTDYYFRIKILDKNAFDLGNIIINLFKKEEAVDISAITYNINDTGGVDQQYLKEEDIFKTKENDNFISKKFAIPNIKEGSVIEYKYSILSPYLGIKDWYFQSDIPKIKSEYDVSILGNYKYNIKIIGFLKLDKDQPSVDRKCVNVAGVGDAACATYSYGMNNVPAFEEEDYMLSKKNYISRITFDLKSSTSYRGLISNYTTSWKKADKSLKKLFFNNQTSKKRFFKNKIPESILSTENNLERAKKIYSFIQNHYYWNEKYWTNEDAKVKQAFEDKSGSVGEINISLYNSLVAAEIETNLVVLSTRENGIPTKLFPVIFDYNYVIVEIIIDGKSYFLDGTNKFLPFGEVPIKVLNGEARIINFKKGGAWKVLKPKFKSLKNKRVKLSLDEDGEFSGYLISRNDGYFASKKRKQISSTNEDDYLENFETENANIEIEDYKVKNLENLEKSLREIYTIKLSREDSLKNKVRINTIFFDKITENPFKLKERNYPVDFAFPRKVNYFLDLTIPENYEITQVPKDLAISLPNKGGAFSMKTIRKDNAISFFTRLTIDKKIFSANEYFLLKEFFRQIIIAENSYIILEKKK